MPARPVSVRPFARTALGIALASVIGLLPMAGQSRADGLFSPILQINDSVITQYDVEQRTLFYATLNAPGDPRETALERLTEEKLQIWAARQMGLSLTSEQIVAGEGEFAQRVELDRDAFVAALAQHGIEEQTFRDFVMAGLLWREVVRTRFASRVEITDAEIDQALSATAPRADAVRVLLSEIILPATTPAQRDQALARAVDIAANPSVEAFSRAARAYSASPSAARGGRLDWADVSTLPPGLAQTVLALAPGQVSEPLPVPNAIAIFQLREVADGLAPQPSPMTIDYATYLIPGGQSPAALAEAARIEASIDTCNDLYRMNRKAGTPDRLERTSADASEIPADVARALADLDENEFSTALTRGGNLALLMLCSRQTPLPEDVTRDQVRAQLRDQRLTAYADAYLEELRAGAIYREP